ncbi:MAG: hypothetical protein M1457_14470, partial [bacterium]|nr:hypothetical protein [bacterium]
KSGGCLFMAARASLARVVARRFAGFSRRAAPHTSAPAVNPINPVRAIVSLSNLTSLARFVNPLVM